MVESERWILPPEVLLVPTEEVPEPMRSKLGAEPGDYVISRPSSRTRAKIIGPDAARLLKWFRSQRSLLEAVILESATQEVRPEEVLEHSFRFLENLAHTGFLVRADSPAAERREASIAIGAEIAGYAVSRCVWLVEDTEVYEAESGGGARAALKILRPGAGATTAGMLEREAMVLRRLEGLNTPQLLQSGSYRERPFLLMTWCDGTRIEEAFADARKQANQDGDGRHRLLELCVGLADAYARLHERGILHGDVHPRNVLLGADGQFQILDFGLASLIGDEPHGAAHVRGGIDTFFDPEQTAARLAGKPLPPGTGRSEQYSLAALLYDLCTGMDYLDFALGKTEMRRQILTEAPLPFSSRGVPPWPELERVLARALAKKPEERFPSVAAFAEALRGATASPRAGAPEIVTEARSPRASLLHAFLKDLESGALMEGVLRSPPTCSINFGLAGVAYALYRIACVRDSAALLATADEWCARALAGSHAEDAFSATGSSGPKRDAIGPISLYHTETGLRVVEALIALSRGDFVIAQQAMAAMATLTQAPCDNLDLTLGHAGLLLGYQLVADGLAGADTEVVGEAPFEQGNHLASRIAERLRSLPPIGECAEMDHLGIAHGWAGILYALMRWRQASGFPDTVDIPARLDQLARLCRRDGRAARWPRRASPRRAFKDEPYWSGWCNGSAGFVHLWLTAHELYRDPRYAALAEQVCYAACEDQPNEGAMADLCCGKAGRAYAALAMYRHGGDRRWLFQAEQLADMAAKQIASASLKLESLYKGRVGVALLAAELEAPEYAAMPLFDREFRL